MRSRAEAGTARERRGITLMETVVALAIVGLTAIGALGAVGADLRAAERARRAVEAEALATQRLALLGLLTAPELASLPDSVAGGAFDAPLQEYRWTTTAARRESDQGVFDVAVRIAWPTGSYAVATALYRQPATVTR